MGKSGLVTKTKVVYGPVRKQKMFIARQAVALAKAMNDPLYDAYIMYKNKALELKRKIILKYGREAIKALHEKGVPVKVNIQDIVGEEE